MFNINILPIIKLNKSLFNSIDIILCQHLFPQFKTLQICRGLVNDTYKMDLILIYPPHLIALACIYIASVLKEKETTAWFEELRVDMNTVSILSHDWLVFSYLYELKQ